MAQMTNYKGLQIVSPNPSTAADAGNALDQNFMAIADFMAAGGGGGSSGFSGYSGIGVSGFSGYSGYSGFSGKSGFSGYSGYSGKSGFSGISGYNGTNATPQSLATTLAIGNTAGGTPIQMGGAQIQMNNGTGSGGADLIMDMGIVALDAEGANISGTGTGGITIGTGAPTTIVGQFLCSSGGVISGGFECTDNFLFNQTTSSTQTLTDGSTISWDCDMGVIANVTLTGNHFLQNAANAHAATYVLIVIQDASGGRTLSYDGNYKFPNATPPTLSTAPNAVDIITFLCDGTYMYGVWQGDFA